MMGDHEIFNLVEEDELDFTAPAWIDTEQTVPTVGTGQDGPRPDSLRFAAGVPLPTSVPESTYESTGGGDIPSQSNYENTQPSEAQIVATTHAEEPSEPDVTLLYVTPSARRLICRLLSVA